MCMPSGDADRRARATVMCMAHPVVWGWISSPGRAALRTVQRLATAQSKHSWSARRTGVSPPSVALTGTLVISVDDVGERDEL